MTKASGKKGEEVFEQLRQMIVDGKYKPGDKLPSENELCKIFNVSRISIRESIKQLKSLGLLETHQGAGTFVRKFNEEQFISSFMPIFIKKLTKKDILHILEVRKIEIMIAGMAAERSTQEGVDELWRIYYAMEKEQDNPEMHYRTDLAFHMQICKMVNNPYLSQICRVLFEALEQAMMTIVTIMGPQKALHYHRKLIDTISKHYVHEAEFTMAEHLKTTIDAVESLPETDSVFDQDQ